MAAKRLNVRAGPHRDAPVVNQLDLGEQVSVISRQGKWIGVGNGNCVYGDYLTRDQITD